VKVAIAAALLVVLWFGSVGASIGIGLYVQSHQEQGWCQILQLITGVPVNRPADPHVDPSRERSYLIYRAALARGRTLGCRPP
jgi:hypothetical protein